MDRDHLIPAELDEYVNGGDAECNPDRIAVGMPAACELYLFFHGAFLFRDLSEDD